MHITQIFFSSADFISPAQGFKFTFDALRVFFCYTPRVRLSANSNRRCFTVGQIGHLCFSFVTPGFRNERDRRTVLDRPESDMAG